MLTNDLRSNPQSRKAEFFTRAACITCGSEDLETLASARFHDEPMYSFFANDAYGENPLPSLEDARWTFVQCRNCGQKFHRDVLTDEWQDIHYNRWITKEAIDQFEKDRGSAGFARAFNTGIHAIERMLLIEKLTRAIRGADPVRLLDFGSGQGKFLSTCANGGFQAVGVELSDELKDMQNVTVVRDLEQLSARFDAATFHAVTLFEVLEHLNDPLGVLKALSRFAMPGAVLILETPDCEHVTGITTREDFDLIGPLGHINAFSAASQERIAQEAGFKRIAPGVAQCTADAARVYKREARRFLQPLLRRTTRQYFVKV